MEVDEIGNIEEPEAPKRATRQRAAKKKDIEFEAKKKVAEAVSQFKNLYDVTDRGYADAKLSQACWTKVSETTAVEIATCVKYWEALKRSASYYAKPQKLPSKSGASADEVISKYRDDWPFGEVMGFYTPSAIKRAESLVSIVHAGDIVDCTMEDDDGSRNTSISDPNESVYVSIRRLKIAF